MVQPYTQRPTQLNTSTPYKPIAPTNAVMYIQHHSNTHSATTHRHRHPLQLTHVHPIHKLSTHTFILNQTPNLAYTHDLYIYIYITSGNTQNLHTPTHISSIDNSDEQREIVFTGMTRIAQGLQQKSIEFVAYKNLENQSCIGRGRTHTHTHTPLLTHIPSSIITTSNQTPNPQLNSKLGNTYTHS